MNATTNARMRLGLATVTVLGVTATAAMVLASIAL